MKWTLINILTPSAVGFCTVSAGDRVFAFGENLEPYGLIPVHILDTIPPAQFRKIIYKVYEGIPTNRFGFTAVVYKEKIYIWGGMARETVFDTLLCFDTETLRWSTVTPTGTLPAARAGHSACVIKNKMYVFGGVVNDRHSNDTYSLDLDTMKWTLVQAHGPRNHTPTRAYHSALALGDKMYVFGGFGENYKTTVAGIHYFDTLSKTWKNMENAGPKNPKCNYAWVYKNNLCMFDTVNATYGDVSKLWIYTPTDDTWRQIQLAGKAPIVNEDFSCVLNGKKLYMIGSRCRTRYHIVYGVNGEKEYQKELKENPNMNIVNGKDVTVRLSVREGIVSLKHSHATCDKYVYILDLSPSLETLCIIQILEHNLVPNTMTERIKYKIDSHRKRSSAKDLLATAKKKGNAAKR